MRNYRSHVNNCIVSFFFRIVIASYVRKPKQHKWQYSKEKWKGDQSNQSQKSLFTKEKKEKSKSLIPLCDRLHIASTFFTFFFSFFTRICWLWGQIFTHCVYTVYVLKNIKNRSHDTIYTFKNYFVAVFSVFSFQFSATISSIQMDPTIPRSLVSHLWKYENEKTKKMRRYKQFDPLVFFHHFRSLLALFYFVEK